MNLITDSLPAIAIGLEDSQIDMMNELPRNSKASYLTGKDKLELQNTGL